jgi:membrane-associated phospholipid phosphatase
MPLLERPQRTMPRLLLAPAARRAAFAAFAVCVAVPAILGTLFAHQRQPSWLDMAVDDRVQASLGRHLASLNSLTQLGTPVPVTAMIVLLVLACLATRRWRGAALVAVAVPAAAALTELLLKPFIHRTIRGVLSFPSGHSTGMFALAGGCAVLLVGPSRPPIPAALRLFLALIAYLAAGAVAVALVGVGAHYFTDTIGGAAVGSAVVLATAFLIDLLPLPSGRMVQVVHDAADAPG